MLRQFLRFEKKSNSFLRHLSTINIRKSTSNSPKGRRLLKQHVRSVLDDKVKLLEFIDQDTYVQKDNKFYGASISSHIRHSLDHFKYVLTVTMNQQHNNLADKHDHKDCLHHHKLTYDIRTRGGEVEKDLKVALKETLGMRVVVDAINVHSGVWDEQVNTEFIANSSTGESYTATSSFERELSFVAHHATHHLAMVRVMLAARGINLVSTSFGVANSTRVYNANQTGSKGNEEN